MNCTIWRSTSTSAPFSASSASAIVAVVIVCSLQIKVDGSHLNLIRAHDGHPVRVDQPLCGKPLRATPSAPRRTPKDLHHFLGHHLGELTQSASCSNTIGWEIAMPMTGFK